jgi:hypothetical protein
VAELREPGSTVSQYLRELSGHDVASARALCTREFAGGSPVDEVLPDVPSKAKVQT